MLTFIVNINYILYNVLLSYERPGFSTPAGVANHFSGYLLQVRKLVNIYLKKIRV